LLNSSQQRLLKPIVTGNFLLRFSVETGKVKPFLRNVYVFFFLNDSTNLHQFVFSGLR